MLKRIELALFLLAVSFLTFTGTAFAASSINPDQDPLQLLRPIYDAITGKHYALSGALGLVGAVALAKRYLGKYVPWLHSDAGGATTTLLMAFGTAMATSLAPGAHLDFAMVKGALLVSFAAAGGYAMLKKLLAPTLMKLSEKAPPWVQLLLRVVLWVFDKPAQAARESAEKAAEGAGDAAVEDHPATGIDGIIGKPTDAP